MMARKLGQSRMAVVAAPTYLARRGVPQTPYDLDAHNCIGLRAPRRRVVFRR
jgi:DNA-binding transcriptional LysR family regulator